MQVFTGLIPFHELRNEACVLWRVLDGCRPVRPVTAIAIGLSNAIWRLIRQCWAPDPKQRPTTASIANSLRRIHDVATGIVVSHRLHLCAHSLKENRYTGETSEKRTFSSRQPRRAARFALRSRLHSQDGRGIPMARAHRDGQSLHAGRKSRRRQFS